MIQIIWTKWLRLNSPIKNEKGWCSYLYRHQAEQKTTVRKTRTEKYHQGTLDNSTVKNYHRAQYQPESRRVGRPPMDPRAHVPRELQHELNVALACVWLRKMTHWYDSIIKPWNMGHIWNKKNISLLEYNFSSQAHADYIEMLHEGSAYGLVCAFSCSLAPRVS